MRPGPSRLKPEIELQLILRQALPGSSLELGLVVRRPRCSMSRDPRRVECTICTALAPDADFTVRTYATGSGLSVGLVCKSRHPKPQSPRSQARHAARPQNVSQVRLGQ